jgi:hypothetical protein
MGLRLPPSEPACGNGCNSLGGVVLASHVVLGPSAMEGVKTNCSFSSCSHKNSKFAKLRTESLEHAALMPKGYRLGSVWNSRLAMDPSVRCFRVNT